jgi:hypothetical protein
MTPDEYTAYQQNLMARQYAGLQSAAGMLSGNPYLQAMGHNPQAWPTPPIAPPESNPVLLLTGDDE